MFRANFKEKNKKMVELKKWDNSAYSNETLVCLAKYINTGKVEISKTIAKEIYELAHQMEMPELVKAARKVVYDSFVVNLNNLSECIEWSDKYNDFALLMLCARFAYQHSSY